MIVGYARVSTDGQTLDAQNATLRAAGAEKLTSSGVTVGTPAYMSPEQAAGSEEIDGRSDIYSLGATFYFCLTGGAPFQEGTVAQKLIWHQMRHPMAIREIRPDVPEELAAVIHKMMAKDPVQRFRMPAEVAEAQAKPLNDMQLALVQLAAHLPATTATGDFAPFIDSYLNHLRTGAISVEATANQDAASAVALIKSRLGNLFRSLP